MEDIDKQDLDEQLEHLPKVILALRRRLRARELQEAEHGINVPPEVTNEILSLNGRIAKHEAELARLRSIAAEGEIPLAEVEYRAALAQAWQPGKPTVAGAAQLELVRLRSGIKPDRAEKLEKEVRAALAEEAVQNINKYDFKASTQVYGCTYNDIEYEIEFQTLRVLTYGTRSLRNSSIGGDQDHMKRISHAILLDATRTANIVMNRFPPELPKIVCS